MEFQKILNFLDTTSGDNDLPRFITKKWIEVYAQSEGNYNVNKEIRIKISMLRSDLCDYSDAYLVVKGDITLEGDNDANKRNKNLAFKNNAPFINCILKINGVKIDNAENLDFVMPMYNLLEYSKNCKKTTGSLWNYYGDEPSNPLSSNSPSGAIFQITVPVVTLSKENDTKLLEQLKSGFKRTIKWNKYRSQMTIQPQNNNLNYLTDPTFTNVNRLLKNIKELLEKIIEQKIVETLFHIIMYKILE